MKRIAMLAAFALVAGMGVAMADQCVGANCATQDDPTVRTLPQDGCMSSNCARPEPATFQRADPWWRSRWALEPEPSPIAGRR
jgi:hypothetical protein